MRVNNVILNQPNVQSDTRLQVSPSAKSNKMTFSSRMTLSSSKGEGVVRKFCNWVDKDFKRVPIVAGGSFFGSIALFGMGYNIAGTVLAGVFATMLFLPSAMFIWDSSRTQK